MILKKKLKKQINKRKNFKKDYYKIKIIKLILSNTKLSRRFRFFVFRTMSKLKQESALINNYCTINGSFKSVYKKYKLSRLPLKNFAVHGSIPGLFKK